MALHFFGQWVPPVLLFGIYNKIIEQVGLNQDRQAGNIEEPEEKAFA